MIRVYTEDELRQIATSQIRGNVTGADVSPYSDYDLWARVLAAMAAGSQAHAASLGRQIFPKDCDDSELAAHAESRGLGYLAPTKARGYIAIEGDAGDVLPAGTLFDSGAYVALADTTCLAAGFTPVTVAEGSTKERLMVSSTAGISVGMLLAIGSETVAVKAIPASGIIDLAIALQSVSFVGDLISGVAGALVPVEASETGSKWNSTIAQPSVVDTVPPGTGIASAAHRMTINGGGDPEGADSLRGRIVDFEAGRAASTNVEAVRTVARAFPDARITEAFVYPNLGYPGHLFVVAYGAAKARELSTLTTDALETFLRAALGSEVSITVEPIDYDGTPADIDITIVPGTGYEPDWGTATLNTFTIAAGGTVSRVNTSTSPVGVIPVGARVLVPITLGAVYRTEQREVSAVDASGFDLTTDLSGPPTTAGIVTSGSPAAQGVIDAIGNLFDSLGPGTYVASATKDRIRWPNPATTGGAVVAETRVLAAAAIEGVLDVGFTSGSFTTRTPAALETIRLGVLVLRNEYP